VLGNKADLAESGHREVAAAAGEELADSIDASFAEVSCLSGAGVEEAIGFAAAEVVALRTGQDVSRLPFGPADGAALPQGGGGAPAASDGFKVTAEPQGQQKAKRKGGFFSMC
jgi:hypothetical protein